jgi:methionine biosynthesis protein MetW
MGSKSMILDSHLKHVVTLIDDDSRVIDIGCGAGELLKALEEKSCMGHGLDIESEKVAAAVAGGISAIQGDADIDLQYYPENGFDYAIMALSLQSMKDPKQVLEEALRIAGKVVVIIPNFGHWKNRLYLSTKGKMPVTSKLSFQWYETPNIHFCTIKDFVALAHEIGCTIESRQSIATDGTTKHFRGNGTFGANLVGPYGTFVLSK